MEAKTEIFTRQFWHTLVSTGISFLWSYISPILLSSTTQQLRADSYCGIKEPSNTWFCFSINQRWYSLELWEGERRRISPCYNSESHYLFSYNLWPRKPYHHCIATTIAKIITLTIFLLLSSSILYSSQHPTFYPSNAILFLTLFLLSAFYHFFFGVI